MLEKFNKKEFIFIISSEADKGVVNYKASVFEDED